MNDRLKSRLDEIHRTWERSIKAGQDAMAKAWDDFQLPPPNGGQRSFETCPCCSADWMPGQGNCPVCGYVPENELGEVF